VPAHEDMKTVWQLIPGRWAHGSKRLMRAHGSKRLMTDQLVLSTLHESITN